MYTKPGKIRGDFLNRIAQTKHPAAKEAAAVLMSYESTSIAAKVLYYLVLMSANMSTITGKYSRCLKTNKTPE